ncbi:phosphotransferase enzyme family protein [Paenibacillus sp. UNC499MF]|uniref:phosphotransferase enzyme family protein n=1 Tax=Paenibacillus sp. UNC499MF TaxID=1502751 RepID=UPI0008A0964C|nr:phosphotransferase [Paenibacillus sp. UNC499MF]SEF71275.1 Ser/Thr protein kinase RdoA involved in Cpx stress response, MazF antagonist [Paenibacillus sp. UNC499MF]
MDKTKLLQTAIKQYGLNPDRLIIEKELQPDSWHGDLHFKIHVDHKSYSARFIGNERYESGVFINLSDEVLTEQVRFCNFLLDSGIPFMEHVSTMNGQPFTIVEEADKLWRFVLFEWLQGQHLTYCTDSQAEKFGAFARKIHNISSKFETVVFPKESHCKGYDHFYQLLCNHADSAKFSPSTNALLKSYFNEIDYHKEKAKTDSYDYIVQSDLNPLNILWDDKEEIIGVVDFESITYTDRVEGLAWLVKWYSRTHGIASHEMSPILAKSVLRGYGAEELLAQRDFERLPSLLWLTGCLNWNFTAKTMELLKNHEDALLKEHLTKYAKRGEMLLSLLL